MVESRMQSARIHAVTRNRDCRINVTSSSTYAVECQGSTWETIETVSLPRGMTVSASARPEFHERGNVAPTATITVWNSQGTQPARHRQCQWKGAHSMTARTLRIVGHRPQGIHPDTAGQGDDLHGLHLSTDDADPLWIWNPLRREIRSDGHLRSGWHADFTPIHRAI